MDQTTVRLLENEFEKAFREIVARLGLKRLPILPSQRTMHLMAKAALAVYVAAAAAQNADGDAPNEHRGAV